MYKKLIFLDFFFVAKTINMHHTTKLIIILQHVITSFVGLVGNCLVLMVYSKKIKKNQTITFFINHLAKTDLFCCAFLIPINCYHELQIGKITSDFMCKFHSFLNILNITYSCQIMMLVAFERYFSICIPHKKIVTIKTAKVALTILFALCFGMAMLGFLSIGIYHLVHISNKSEHLKNITSLINSDYIESEGILKKEFNLEDISLENAALGGHLSVTTQYMTASSANISMLNSDELNESDPKQEFTQSFWMITNNCFPNNKLLSISYFAYIRTAQHLLLVVNFLIIFIMYLLILVFVSKRRNNKMKEINYFRTIILNSKRSVNRKRVPKSPGCLAKCLGSDFAKENKSDMNFFSKDDDMELNYHQNMLASQPGTHDEKHADLGGESISETNNYLDIKQHSQLRSNFKTITEEITEEVSQFHEIVVKGPHKKSIASIRLLKQKDNLIANLKTAFMLFVVTLIMLIVYTPAVLTSIGFIAYNPIHWNIIYINNASNPLIYSFLNVKFRKILKIKLRKFFRLSKNKTL